MSVKDGDHYGFNLTDGSMPSWLRDFGVGIAAILHGTTTLSFCGGCVTTEPETIRVGDMMRFSVEMIEDMKSQPDERSPLVRVVAIRVEGDGSKTILMELALCK